MGPKKAKSLFRRINEWLHLWLGLASGLVVFIVCLTAAVWVFRDEITGFTETEGRVAVRTGGAFLAPSILREQADRYLLSNRDSALSLLSVVYETPGKAAVLTYGNLTDKVYKNIFLDPYNAKVLHDDGGEMSGTQKFMIFLRAGHRFLWLNPKIGSPIVGASCIIFGITLITGLIWWYPNKWNKSTRAKSFKIKWNAKWKRLNIDLHNVLGFYAFLVALILTITGIYYTFDWFERGYHWLLTGGKPRLERFQPGHSLPRKDLKPMAHADDSLWQRYVNKGYERVTILYPKNAQDTYTVFKQLRAGVWYNGGRYSYDQYTLAKVKQTPDFERLSPGEKIYQMNFELHVGNIGGLITKIMASLASLIGASLPVTGFIIWYNRKWGRKSKRVIGKPV